MKKFPIYIQRDLKDCGAACIKMISEFYGLHYSGDDIRDICKISRSGVSLLELSKVLESFGFRTVGGFLDIDTLINKAVLPCIIHWEQEHFVVLYKIKKKKRGYTFYIADPAFGLMEYTQTEFKQFWYSTNRNNKNKGVALLVYPDKLKDTTKRVDDSIDLKYVFTYFKKYKAYLIQLVFGLIIASVIQLILPLLTQSIVDIGISDANVKFIYIVLIAQFALLIGKMSMDFIRNWILLHISTRINLTMISDFFIKLMKLPMYFFDSKMLGDLIQRIEDHERVESFFTAQTLSIIFAFFTVLVFSIVLFVFNKLIFIIFFTGSIVYAYWLFLFKNKRKIIDYKLFNQRAKSKTKTYQLINGMQEIKLQNCSQRKRWEWEDTQAELFEVNVQSLKLRQVQETGNLFINESKNIIITFIAAIAVINGNMTLGTMLAIQYIIGQLSVPIEQVAQFIYDLQDAKISLDRINEIRNKPNENVNRIPHIEIENKTIVIENLYFKYYGTSKYVLKNINLTIPNGKKTAIVGSSGSGKTTLIKILLQYYDIEKGLITVDRKNLNTINTEFWRQICGTVMQDGFIFSDSIARNIAITSEEINSERLRFATDMANISEFIDNLPLKYNTIVGEEGRGLSQGQKQRLLIARAIYKNPDFIFFDEATNALDATNEKIITEHLNTVFQNQTVLVVAHRLSTVKDADQIIVLDDGEIVEVGKHEYLVNKKGVYFNLIKNQLELGG